MEQGRVQDWTMTQSLHGARPSSVTQKLERSKPVQQLKSLDGARPSSTRKSTQSVSALVNVQSRTLAMTSPYLLATLSGPSPRPAAAPRFPSPSPGAPVLLRVEPEEACSRRKFLVAGLAVAPAAFWVQHQASAEVVGEPRFETYFGTAASASSYGGYGGNSSKKDAAEYIFSVPSTWKERLVSKVEKGTNGTDAEFYNPKRKTERTYLTFLSGFRKLAPRDTVLNDLSLSDVTLQDAISQADGDIRSTDRTDSTGQLYYEYEIAGPDTHDLIFVTCARNKLYAHFVTAPYQDWKRDEPMLRRIHDSFMTVGL